MLRMKPIANAKRAEQYYARSDGGYYHEVGGLRCEWGGTAARLLGLVGTPELDQFRRLLHGLHPETGEQLTAKLIENRIPAWDLTASVPKGVSLVLERGDARVRDAIWQAAREAMAMLEEHATTRVRAGGQQDDRATGNLLWYAVEHAETRPIEDASLPEGHPWRLMPDMDRHIHFVVPNLTYDPAEEQWKAVKFRPIMDRRMYFDRSFESLLSAKMAGLGYAIETKWQHDGKGGGRYRTWDIMGMPEEAIAQNSRRSSEIGELEASIVAERKAGDADAPGRLSAMARDRLGATSRQDKREDVTLAECRAFWDGRMSEADKRAITATITLARLAVRAEPEHSREDAARFSMRHHFEQRSVVPLEELAITAMELGLGVATPRELEAEMRRQGLIVRSIAGRVLATTAEVLAEEEMIAAIASKGLGSVNAAGLSPELQRGKLNDGQWRAVTGLLRSENRINLVLGPAGAGKSSLLSACDRGMKLAGQKATYLATTAKATEVLQEDGFQAHTLARFLVDDAMQAEAKGSRIVVDEASMMGHKDAYRLFRLAEKLDLKLILVGDPMQHGAVPRGAVLPLLKQYADIRPFELTDILRQKDGDYREAAWLLSRGETLAGFDLLDSKGWVHEVADDEERYRRMAAEYVAAIASKQSSLVVSPTHAEAARITAAIRSQLREAGMLGEEERQFTRLVQVNASEAERGQASTYLPGDVLIFHQNCPGGITKGDRLTVGQAADVPLAQAARFSLYRPEVIGLSRGDKIRFIGTVKTLVGKHTLRNGATKMVAGFDARGNIRLDNGWVISRSAGLLRHGFVETSFGAQGQTHHRVILGMSSLSTGAMNQEQLYVSSTRGKEGISVYTDARAEIREAVQRSSQKATALDIVPKAEPPKAEPPKRDRPTLAERIRRQWEQQRRRWFVDRMRQAGERMAAPQWRRRSHQQAEPLTHAEKHLERERERGSSRER